MTSVRSKDFFLAGDIGGTKTNLGLFKRGRRRPRMTAFQSFSSREPGGLEALVEKFLARHAVTVAGACFGIAGPVTGGSSKPTNLPWAVSEKVLARRFGWPHVRLVNDLAATAMAIPVLARPELLALNRAKSRKGRPLALVAPGTGLGQALLIYHGGRYIPVPSEGGHADFSPNNTEEVDLWRYLHKRFGHVSLERVLSGPGLANIYFWLKDTGRYREPAWLARKITDADPSQTITAAALKRRTPLCVAALDMFIALLGAAAGNLALIGATFGGVYLGGGISPKIIPFLQKDTFMAAFTRKGRFKGLLEKIPVKVIQNDTAALLGAACGALDDA
ncbi:MAG: glucokinase [Proteobacteria bacterium]|nr:glucokinase [Pseudomonadota bacterium]